MFKKLLMNKLFLIFVSTGLLVLFVMSTDPNKISLPFVLIPFLVIGFILYHLTSLLLNLRKQQKRTFLVKTIPLSISFSGVCLLLLGSLHQLTWKDSLLVCGFTVLFWLYVVRADFLKRPA